MFRLKQLASFFTKYDFERGGGKSRICSNLFAWILCRKDKPRRQLNALDSSILHLIQLLSARKLGPEIDMLNIYNKPFYNKSER